MRYSCSHTNSFLMISFSRDSAVRNSIIAGLATFTVVATALMPTATLAAINLKYYPNTTCSGSDASSFVSGTDVCAKATGLGTSHNHHIDIFSPADSVNPFASSVTGTGNREIAFVPDVCGEWTGRVFDDTDSTLDIENTFTVTSCATPTPTPTPSDTPTPTPSDTPTPTPTPSVSPTPTPSATPTPTPTPSSTPTDTPTPTPTPEVTTNTDNSGGGGFVGGVAFYTPSPTPTPSVSATPEPTQTPEVLGASTQLPATGLSVLDALLLALSAGIFMSGLVLTVSSARRA